MTSSCFVLMLFRESGRKRKKREEGGSLNASACVTRSVVSGGRRREGSAKTQRRWREMRNPWKKTRTKLKKNQRLRCVLHWIETVSFDSTSPIPHCDFFFLSFQMCSSWKSQTEVMIVILRSPRKRPRSQTGQIKTTDPWGWQIIRGVHTLKIRRTEEGS